MTNAARALSLAVVVAATSIFIAAAPPARATNRLADQTDRSAFQSWFTFLADAQFERTTDDVVDCAALVRHAYREALRSHSPEWYRRNRLPLVVAFPDVRSAPFDCRSGRPELCRGTPPVRDGAWLLFRVGSDPHAFAEFADAATLIRYNTRAVGRDVRGLRSGDLLYFRQDTDRSPDHLMIFIGDSRFDRAGHDWVVYHTGPQNGGPGEVRKVSLHDLAQHPSPRWRPLSANPAFVGIFRLSILESAP